VACELRTSHSDHCGEEGTWRPAGCNIRNEGTQPCGGPFWGHVFYCMGEHEACNDGYGRFYAEGKPKQKQTLYPDERLDMRSVKPLPVGARVTPKSVPRRPSRVTGWIAPPVKIWQLAGIQIIIKW